MSDVRMYSWFQGGLSWAYVMARLAQAFEELGNNVYFNSTNGLADNDDFVNKERMLKSTLALQSFGPGKKQIDLDITYTVPQNFPKRFLSNSKHKCAIYNYETWAPDGGWPKDWKRFYNLVDFYLPSSNFSAEIFCINGVPAEKTFVIPHGVDTKVFNSNITPVKISTDKKFKFVSVVAPHFRKNIDLLLEAFCEAFTKQDDVCLVLKSKVFKYSDGIYDEAKNPKGRKGFEIVLGDVFKNLKNRYGDNMPEIIVLNGHVENVASIYNACQCHITTTGSEGFGMPMLESMGCNMLNIAPRYSGHLDFMNDDNSLLIDTYIRPAKQVEQYWNYNPKAKIGQPDKTHTVELMRKAVREYDQLMAKFKPNMEKIVQEYSWTNAVKKIIDATEGKLAPYKKGTYELPR